MTPARLVDEISRAAHSDPRTVRRVLAGTAPYSVVWRRIAEAAKAQGVQVPEPVERKPREHKPCPECARLRAHLVEQMQDWKRQYSAKCEALNESVAECARLRARIAELEKRLAERAPEKRLHVIGADGREIDAA